MTLPYVMTLEAPNFLSISKISAKSKQIFIQIEDKYITLCLIALECFVYTPLTGHSVFSNTESLCIIGTGFKMQIQETWPRLISYNISDGMTKIKFESFCLSQGLSSLFSPDCRIEATISGSYKFKLTLPFLINFTSPRYHLPSKLYTLF